jgi:hypothetical protein
MLECVWVDGLVFQPSCWEAFPQQQSTPPFRCEVLNAPSGMRCSSDESRSLGRVDSQRSRFLVCGRCCLASCVRVCFAGAVSGVQSAAGRADAGGQRGRGAHTGRAGARLQGAAALRLHRRVARRALRCDLSVRPSVCFVSALMRAARRRSVCLSALSRDVFPSLTCCMACARAPCACPAARCLSVCFPAGASVCGCQGRASTL